MKLIWKRQNTSHFWPKDFVFWATLTYSTSAASTGWNNCSELKQSPSRLDVLFLMSVFRLYPGFKMSFEHNSVRKNLFLSACFCWESRLFLREMDQKFKFGGTIGYGDSYLEFLIHLFKVFRLHAILRDAAGAVRANSGKGPGYWSKGPGPETFTELCGTVDVLNTVSFQTFFLELERVNILQKQRKNAKFLAFNWINRWKIWKITAVPKFNISLMKKLGFTRVTYSNPRPHFTVQSVKQNCLISG